MPFWNNIESLRQLSLALMWAAAIFAVLAAGTTWLRYYVDRRASELSAQALLKVDDARRQQLEATAGELESLHARDEENRRRQEAAEKELAALRLKAAPRILSASQAFSLEKFLRSEAPDRVVIKANINATDARAYSEQIASSLRNSGWSVRIDNAILAGPDTSGVWITIKDQAKVPRAAPLLHHALKAAGIENRAHYDPTMDGSPDEVWLTIGTK